MVKCTAASFFLTVDCNKPLLVMMASCLSSAFPIYTGVAVCGHFPPEDVCFQVDLSKIARPSIYIHTFSSVKVLITAGANIVLYNEGAVITSCFRRLLSS